VWPTFLNQPVLAAVFAATLGVWGLVELRQASRGRAEATKADRYSLLVLRVCFAIGFLLGALARRETVAAIPSSPYLIGLIILVMWIGIGLRWWCFQTLGRCFTFSVMTSKDQPVITIGPYRVLRHPSYAGLLLILLGIGLTFGNLLSLAAVMLFATIGLLNRIRVEEAALSTALGPQYEAFARDRKRLIPFVW
jgi:protein-S-isoprenylcysteine O-methyltransferase Ste14